MVFPSQVRKLEVGKKIQYIQGKYPNFVAFSRSAGFYPSMCFFVANLCYLPQCYFSPVLPLCCSSICSPSAPWLRQTVIRQNRTTWTDNGEANKNPISSYFAANINFSSYFLRHSEAFFFKTGKPLQLY